MTTVRSVIRRALRRLAAVPTGQDPSPEEEADSLGALNDMLHGLKAEGGNIGFGTLGLEDDLPTAREYDESIINLLMRTMAPEFSIVLTVNQAQAAITAKNALQAAFAEIPVLGMDLGLRSRLHGDSEETF